MGMIPVKCPECGADIELDDSKEFGFCLYCGTKVMQDKLVVEHTGKVKVDNSEFVEKFLQNARRAKQKEDWEETEKYYNLVEQNDPSNIEAIFYSAYGRAKLSLVDDDIYKRQQVFKVLTNCVSIIDDNYSLEKADVEEQAIKDIAKDVSGMMVSDFVYKQWTDGYGFVTRTNENDTYTLFKSLAFTFEKSINNIIKVDNKVYLHQILIDLYTVIRALSYFSTEYKNLCGDLMQKEHEAIKELDPNHVIPEIKQIEVASSGGCYVATAVYGSYDCPEVWTLRRYRDNQLAKTWYGRLFIHTYYAISPRLVKWFGDTQWFKNMWKPKLDSMVKELQEAGVENTPYEDKIW